jgi:hypothetical protein
MTIIITALVAFIGGCILTAIVMNHYADATVRTSENYRNNNNNFGNGRHGFAGGFGRIEGDEWKPPGWTLDGDDE